MGRFLVFVALIGVVLVIVRALAAKGKPASRSVPPPDQGWPRSSTAEPARPPQRSAAPSRSRGPAFEIRWFGKGSELSVAGIRLASPGVYASASESRGRLWATDPSEILMHAPVRRPVVVAPDMDYWPWYSRIEPENRFEYLSWVASGRTSLPRLEGYLFLYFYGIERRLLVDEADRPWGLQEIVRLRKLDEPRIGTKEGRSFRGYSTGLLWFEIARTPDRFDNEAFGHAMRLTERWTPELLGAPLAWLAAKGRPLPAELARCIAEANPTAHRSVVTKRVSNEFNELFEARYRDRFGGEGITLKVSKRPAWHTYRPASGGLQEVRVQVPNPLGISTQFKALPEIWNSCIADLRRLSRVTGEQEHRTVTTEAWEAMPAELRAEVDHPLADSVTKVVGEHASARADEGSGIETTMVPAGRFAELVGIERRPTLTASQSRKVATTIEWTGYGLVPDARISPIRYGWDDLVAVVPGLDDDDVESSRYNAAACVLRLGLAIALADGQADEVELRMLTDHIDSVFGLSPPEQVRITALRKLLLTTGSDIRPIAQKIQEMLPPDARRRVGRLLVVIAAATNGIDRAERSALRKAFRAMDLPPELLEETIREVAPDEAEGEVTVRSGAPGHRQGEPIPSAPGATGFRLNHEAISTILAETREVSAMLAAAMNEVDAESGEGGEPTVDGEGGVGVGVGAAVASALPPAAPPAAVGPAGPYGLFFAALIERDRWSRSEAEGIARGHGLMLDAGIETINDWAFDALGGPVIEEEGEELVVDRSVLDASS